MTRRLRPGRATVAARPTWPAEAGPHYRSSACSHPVVQLSPHCDKPTERIWAALKAQLANTAVTWTERIHQARVYFRQRVPDQMLTTAAPVELALAAKGYAQNVRQFA
jgi:hypothetical protein